MLPPPISPLQSIHLDHKRIRYQLACLQTCKNCTESYLNCDLIYTTIGSGLVFSYCAKMLHKLSTLQDPHWDTALVPETVDVVGLIERCADAAERSNAILKAETGEDSVFIMAAKTLREMAPTWRVSTTYEQTQLSGNEAVMDGWNGAEVMDLPMVDLSDDFWLSGLFTI
jgi:hypothetical protein